MLEDIQRIAQRRIPGVRWVVQEGQVVGRVYGTFFAVCTHEDRAFVSVAGERRCRPTCDLEDVVDVLRDSLVRRRDALNRALEGST